MVSFLRYDNIHPVVAVGLKNYAKVLDHRIFWLSFKNTLIFSGGVTAMSLVVSLILAHSLSRITKLGALFRSLTMFPLGRAHGCVRVYLGPDVQPVLRSHLRLSDQNRAVVRTSGYFRQRRPGHDRGHPGRRLDQNPVHDHHHPGRLESINPSLYESARVDGADSLQIFRYISLALNKKAIMTAVLITTIFSFRTIDTIFSMTFGGPHKGTYTFGFYIIDNIINSSLRPGRAMSIILIIIMLIIGALFIHQVLKRQE